jgi:chemotaxis protein CheC
MSGHPQQIDPELLESLREVGNVGSGNAASKLGELLRRRCMIDIPEVSFLNFEVLKEIFETADSMIVCIQLKIMGDIPATLLVLLKRVYAYTIADYISGIVKQTGEKDRELNVQFALKKVGDLITKSFSDAISKFLQTKASFTMPEIQIDSWSMTLKNAIASMGSPEEEKLVISCTFFDPEKTFEGKFLYILAQRSKEILLNRLSLLLEE